jgi:hypothetical protein
LEITTALKLLSLILWIGLIGWFGYFLFFFDAGSEKEKKLKRYCLIFLSGFAVVSIFSFILASLGWFRFSALIACSILLGASYGFFGIRKQSGNDGLTFRGYFLFCALLGVAICGFARISKPYEAIICGYDASVYTASGFQVSRTGGLTYRDPLVQEATREERKIFLHTGGSFYLRFPGGVHISNIQNGTIHFGFFPLFIVWMGIGVSILGANGFLYVLSLFTILSILLLFFLAYELQGLLVSVSMCIAFFFFFPQFYFSHTPMSEILAQTLFLAGLWTFLTSHGGVNEIPHGTQRLTGMLWGAMFNCKIEVMLFTVLSLILIFTASSSHWKRLYEWRVLIRWLVAALLLMLYWQLSTGSYLTIHTLNNAVLFAYLWLPVGTYLHDFLALHPLPGTFLFLVGSALILIAVSRILATRKIREYSWRQIAFGIGFTAFIALSLIGRRFVLKNLFMNLDRITLYTSDWILLLLVVGIAAFFFRRKEPHPGIILFLLFVVPTVTYLFYAFISPEQPLYIRRFFPVSFPLLFLLGFSGLYRLTTIPTGRFRFVFRIAFTLLSFSIALFFFQKTRYLIEKPLFTNILPQVEDLAGKFPDQALIITPRLDAGIYMEMPLQYMIGLDTISLSLHPYHKDVSYAYLERQINQRPVMILALRTTDSALQLLDKFSLNPQFGGNIQFSIVPPSKNFPEKSIAANLEYAAYRLEMKRPPVVRSEISFNDQEVSFLRFNTQEPGLRWTKNNSEILDFTYDTKGEPVFLVVSLAGLPSRQVADSFQVIVNDGVKTTLQRSVGNDFWFRMDDPSVKTITRVTLRSKVFVPKNLGINEDPRELGLAFVKLKFVSGSSLRNKTL